MFNKLFFNKERTLLAFEYGVILCNVARERGIEIDADFIKKAEVMIESEFKSNKNTTRLSIDMIPNILSVFELDLSK